MNIDTKNEEMRINSTVNSLVECVALIKDQQSVSVLVKEILKTLDNIGPTVVKEQIQRHIKQRFK